MNAFSWVLKTSILKKSAFPDANDKLYISTQINSSRN